VTELKKERITLGVLRNTMSACVERAVNEGVTYIITKHGKDAAIMIAQADLDRIEALLELLVRRANERLGIKDPVVIKERREEDSEVAALVKRAVTQAIEGDSSLLHDMARRYLHL